MLSAKERIKDFIGVIILWVMILWDDIKDTLITMVVTFLACMIISTYIFKPVVVNGTSMYPTVKDGDVGFSSIIKKKTTGIERFDIVVIDMEDYDKILIKRVIGLPGETIEFRDDVLYINGEVFEQNFLDSDYVAQELAESFSTVFTHDFETVLGEDEYFCMGDNRLVSADSRAYGPFKGENILSCGIFVLFPFSEFGLKK